MSNSRICFIAPEIYPLFSEDIELVGGGEAQLYMLSKELIKEGFEVCFITKDFGQKNIEVKEGIQIVKVNLKKRGMKFFNFYCSLMNGLNMADAEIYHQRGASELTGLTGLCCSRRNKNFVFAAASSVDCDGTYLEQASLYARTLYKYGIKKADKIINQAEYMREAMKNTFGRDSVVIRNGYRIPDKVSEKENPPFVLWVSRLVRLKRAELFIEMAKNLPEIRFRMIGSPVTGEEEYFDEIKELAKEIDNLEFVGYILFKKINDYFEKASVFVNTSSIEGFPDTFIQSWINCTPVVSFLDPDELICEKELGFRAKSFEEMVENVKLLVEDEHLRTKMGRNGRKYAKEEHDIKKTVRDHVKVYESLL